LEIRAQQLRHTPGLRAAAALRMGLNVFKNFGNGIQRFEKWRPSQEKIFWEK